MLKKTIIFDIDGTLADISHRRPFVTSATPNWKKFNDLMGEDIPNRPVVNLYKTLHETKKFLMILVTGREEKYRKITEQWLIWNNIPFEKIYMRKTKDFRKDDIVKKDILNKLRQQGHEIEFAVDDRDSVVKMWRDNNITCFQCDYGQF